MLKSKLWMICRVVPLLFSMASATPAQHDFSLENCIVASADNLQLAQQSSLNVTWGVLEFSSPSSGSNRALPQNNPFDHSNKQYTDWRSKTDGNVDEDFQNYWYLLITCLLCLLAAILFIVLDYTRPYFSLKFSRKFPFIAYW
jgi:hypothetical protein